MKLQIKFHLLALIGITVLLLASCSNSPREQYADKLQNNLYMVHAALIKYKANPSGVTDVSGQGITGQRSLAVAAAIKTKDLFDSLTLVNYVAFRDIQQMDGYEAWADELAKKLREKADTCLAIVREIKSDYKKNQDNPEYRKMLIMNNVPAQQYPLLWLTKDDELVFALSPGHGVPVETILRVDFRTGLNSIRNKGKERDSTGSIHK